MIHENISMIYLIFVIVLEFYYIIENSGTSRKGVISREKVSREGRMIIFDTGLHFRENLLWSFIKNACTWEITRVSLSELLEEISLPIMHKIIFQHDEAPPHFTRKVRNVLNRQHNFWIGRGGTVRWASRSLDLTPLHFILWDYIKELIYAENKENIGKLKHNLVVIIIVYHTRVWRSETSKHIIRFSCFYNPSINGLN